MKILRYHHPNYKYKTHPLLRYCGALQVAHIIEAKVWKKLSYRSLMPWISGYVGLCGPGKVFNVLKNNIDNVSLTQNNTIDVLKREIDDNKICLLLVGHGYNQGGEWFNIIKAIILQHYISVWWYDEEKDWFFVYDSSIKSAQNLPIGNIFLSTWTLKKCWSRWWLWIYQNILIKL